MTKIIAALTAVVFGLSPVLASASVSISLNGGSVTITQGQAYNEPGYSAFSTTDGDVTSSVSVSGINTNTIGTHSILYSVTDSALDSDIQFRSLTVVGGGSTMPYCSSPSAPGWHVDIAGGGCGGTDMYVPRGASIMHNGALFVCPDWFPGGCMVK